MWSLGVSTVRGGESVDAVCLPPPQMQAGLLQQEQKDEFCTLARSVIQQAKEKVHKEMQASEPLTMLSEHSASERQEVEETFTVVHSSAALEQASDKKDAVPCKPEQDPVAQREGDGHSSPVPQDRTTVVEHAAARKEAVASKEDKTFSKEEIPYREVGAPSRDSTPLVEGVAPPKEGKATPKEGVAQPKEGGTLPDEGVVTPEEDETPPKEGRTPAKEGGTPPKEGGTPPKEGGAPPKEGGTLPKEGGAPPKDVAHNFSVPLSHQSSTDSSAVSTPSEPVKTIGESTAEEVGGGGRWTMDSSDGGGGGAGGPWTNLTGGGRWTMDSSDRGGRGRGRGRGRHSLLCETPTCPCPDLVRCCVTPQHTEGSG